MRDEMEEFDQLREKIIAESRIVLKASKQAIYSAHRADLKEAEKLLGDAKTAVSRINKMVEKDVCLQHVGSYLDALEEYAEASCYVHYLQTEELPTPKQLGVRTEIYLGALSDLIGELVRKAINECVKGNHKTPLEIKKFVEELYAELMLFDWRNTPVRKKFDAIKYGLEKLEDLALKIGFK